MEEGLSFLRLSGCPHSKHFVSHTDTHQKIMQLQLIAFYLLHISALLAAKRFRDRGNKDGAVKAICVLQSAGLGEVCEAKPQRGTNVVYMVLCKCLVYSYT